MNNLLLAVKYIHLFINTILPAGLQLIKDAELVKQDIVKIKQKIDETKKGQ
jgi:hypothetical protein